MARSSPPKNVQRIANRVGLSAIGYSDLSQKPRERLHVQLRQNARLIGNTAAHMRYAYARVRGIFRTEWRCRQIAICDGDRLGRSTHPAERALAVSCLRFAEGLDLVVADYRPESTGGIAANWRTISARSMKPVRCWMPKAQRRLHTRLTLCDLTARIIKQGLNLLGIETVERM